MENNSNADLKQNDDNLNRFKRFLNTGNDRLSAYIYNVELNIESIKSLFDLIKENRGSEAVNLIKKYKEERLLLKNETLIYGLAVCARSKDENAKKAAYEVLNIVCQNPLDFFKFVSICETISFEIAFKLNGSKLTVNKSSIDVTKTTLKTSTSQMKLQSVKSMDKLCIENAITELNKTIAVVAPSSRQSSATLKPLLSLRLNSGKSQHDKEGNKSDLIIETSTAELFSSRKTSAASTLRSELTFLTTERKDSALPSHKTAHIPLLSTSRVGSGQSAKKIELPLISERTNSGKSRNQTPLQHVRPGSAKPIVFFDLNGDLTPSRRFSDAITNSLTEYPSIVSPGNVQASYPNTKSPSIASIEPKLSSRPLSRTQSAKSAILVRPPSRTSSIRAATPIQPLPPIQAVETSKDLIMSTEIVTAPIVESTPITETPIKKHVDLSVEPIVIKSNTSSGSTGWGR
jgi:hypothetical protein